MAAGADLSMLRGLADGLGRRATALGLGDDVTATVRRGADGVPVVAGDLERFVANFVDASPRRGSGLFDPPTDAERATLLEGWKLIRRGDVADAADLVRPLGMRVTRFVDETTDEPSRHVLMFEAPPAAEPLSRGHGLFAHRTGALKGAAHIQVPHPWDDIATDLVGARLYLDSASRSLAVAGASRYALPDGVADAAHSQASFFHSISEVNARKGARLVQLHGFSRSKNPSYYGEAVVSTGDVPSAHARATHRALRDGGIDAKLYTGKPGPGGVPKYVNLAARHNIQGIHARRAGASFVHVELADSVRLDPARRAQAVTALLDGVERTKPTRTGARRPPG